MTKRKEWDWELVPGTLPQRVKRGKYAEIIEAFMESGEESAKVSGSVTKDVTVGTLVTSLGAARKGRPVSIHRDGDEVWLSRKAPDKK